MGGVVALTVYYLRSKRPIESLNRLIIIDGIIFTLYFIFFSVIGLVIINPIEYYLFYFVVVATLYRFYHLLLIPLIYMISITYYYIRINNPVRSKILYKILIAKTSIIIIFFLGFLLLNWAIPHLGQIYDNWSNFD